MVEPAGVSDMISRLIDGLASPAVAQLDAQESRRHLFENSCHDFGGADFTMLKALYQAHISDLAYEDLFSKAALFIKEHEDIVRIKMRCEIALKVWERQKRFPPSTSDNLDVHNVVNSIFKAKFERLRRLLSYYTKPFPHLLVGINAELKKLYTIISNIHENLAVEPISKQSFLGWSDDFIVDVNRSKFQEKEEFLEAKRKIILWRSFYKTVSICIF